MYLEKKTSFFKQHTNSNNFNAVRRKYIHTNKALFLVKSKVVPKFLISSWSTNVLCPVKRVTSLSLDDSNNCPVSKSVTTGEFVTLAVLRNEKKNDDRVFIISTCSRNYCCVNFILSMAATFTLVAYSAVLC